MTNKTREALRAMSLKILRENLAACAQAKKDWMQLAAGALDDKPSCSFCEVSHAVGCTNCMLRAFADPTCDPCGEEFERWCKALAIANKLRRRRPLHSAPVCRAAGKMAEKIALVTRAVQAELKRRAK